MYERFDSVKYNASDEERGVFQALEHNRDYLLDQALERIEAINTYNENYGGLWLADLTDLSLMPPSDLYDLFGGSEDELGDFQYYAGGLFDFEGALYTGIFHSPRLTLRDNSMMVDSFDWRNRHGKNWITSVKNQLTGYFGWAFSTIGALESMVNLYYNRITDVDLSEQEIISNVLTATNHPNYNSYLGRQSFQWIKQHGVSEETSFPFANGIVPTSQKGSFNELVSIRGYMNVSNNDEDIKRALIQYGPLVSGLNFNLNNYVGHEMLLVGYGNVNAGDTIRCHGQINGNKEFIVSEDNPYVGSTYWIFKNSLGASADNNQGYVNVIYMNDASRIVPYRILYPLTSLQFTEEDRIWEDNDGDGYYNWGIGPKPSNCPSWIPDTPDGDDSNAAEGPMDEYGVCESNHADIYAGCVMVDEVRQWNSAQFAGRNVVIKNSGKLTINEGVILAGTWFLVKTGG